MIRVYVYFHFYAVYFVLLYRVDVMVQEYLYNWIFLE